MSQGGRGRPPDLGECRVWPAIVLATSAEGLLEVDCPSMSDTPLVNVAPEIVSPLMWCPEVGDAIEVVEVFASDPADAVRWRGWRPSAQEDTTEQEEGATVLTSPGRDLSIGLDDGVDDDGLAAVDGDGETTAPEPQRVWIGRRTAKQRAVLGNALKTHQEKSLDTLEDIRAELQKLAAETDGIATDVGLFAAVLAGPPGAVDPVVKAAGAALATAMGLRNSSLATIRTTIIGLASDITDRKNEIEAHLSRLVKISRE